MPTATDYGRYLLEVANSTGPISEDAASPYRHFREALNAAYNLAKYARRTFATHSGLYESAFTEHLATLRRRAFLGQAAAFERFLKELLAVCIREVAPLAADDRLEKFHLKGSAAVGHLREQHVGRALCESDTFLDLKEVVAQFKRVLALPDGTGGNFQLFTKAMSRPQETDRTKRLGFDDLSKTWLVVEAIFQCRHTLVHNCGLLTVSDAAKLQRLLRRTVEAPAVLAIEDRHLLYAKEYLRAAAAVCEARVADRLADVLAKFAMDDPPDWNKAAVEARLSDVFQVAFTIA